MTLAAGSIRQDMKERMLRRWFRGQRLEVQHAFLEAIALALRFGAPASAAPTFLRDRIRRLGGLQISYLGVVALFAILGPFGAIVGLAILARGQRLMGRGLDQVWSRLQDEVQFGGRLSDGMAAHPAVFEPSTIAAIRLGEAASDLPTAVGAVYQNIGARLLARRELANALVYPATTGVVLLFAATVVYWKILPTFAEIFGRLGAPLPTLALHLEDATSLGKALAGLAALLCVSAALWRLPGVDRLRDAFLVRLPCVGTYLRTLNRVAFLRLLATALRAGTTIDQAVARTAEAVSSRYFRHGALRAASRLANGASLGEALTHLEMLESLQAYTLHTAAARGDLLPTLDLMAARDDRNLNHQRKAMSRYVEIGALLVVGIAVGLYAIAVYQVLFEVTGLDFYQDPPS